MNPAEKLSTLESHLWTITSSLRGFERSSDSAGRLIALIALRKLLDRAHEDGTAPMTFADLAHVADPERSLGRALHTRARPKDAGEIYEDLLSLIEPLGVDRVALTVAIQGIASIPHDLLTGPGLGMVALRFLARLAGKETDGFPPTPGVARLMVELADPPAGCRIADPHCRTGFLLSAAGDWARERGRPLLALDGSDPNTRLGALARVVMFLSELPSSIETANVLVSPGPRTSGPYDVVLSAPPMGMRPPAHLHIEASDRFLFGVPTRAADLLFVQHAASMLPEVGVAVIVVAWGPLFRSGAEADVRRGLVGADMIDSVIGLPSGLLTGTNLPCALLVLRRGKARARRGTIVMVEMGGELARLERRVDLSDQIVSTIVHAVRDGGSNDAANHVRARVVDSKVVANNDYSLLPSRYFENAPVSEVRDLTEIAGDLEAARSLESEAMRRVAIALEALIAAAKEG